jgi:hypothetical protein
MSELLFEGYGVPSVSYGVDTLFSFSRTGAQDGVALGMGNASTQIIPVIGGRGIMSSARQSVPFFPFFFPSSARSGLIFASFVDADSIGEALNLMNSSLSSSR